MHRDATPAGLRGWLHGRTAHWSPTVRGLLWAAASGALFSVLNATLRGLALQLDPMQTQFLRYLFGLLVMLPLLLARPARCDWWPRHLRGQFTRGAVHTLGLVLWFLALPHIPLADTTASASRRRCSSWSAPGCSCASRCAGSAGWPRRWALPAC